MAHERLRPEFTFDEEKIKQLKQIAPECFEDGKINPDTLLQNLGQWKQDEDDELEHVRRLVERLPELVPWQPSSLLHGDLWTGNAMSDEKGAPAIIDPAAHYGWAEAELAMTTLFDSFPREFYRAYEEVRPLEKGYRDRFDIYNLYHLLNHLNLFGRSYLGQVRAILRRYQ